MVTSAKVVMKVAGLPTGKEYAALPFGRAIEHRAAIAAFKESAKVGYILCKHRSVARGFREFRDLYQPKEWLYVDDTGPNYKSDSIKIWYRA